MTIWRSILDRRIGYKKREFPNPNIVAKFFGTIDVPPPTTSFPKTLLRFLPPFAKYGLCAADEAVNMAFGDRSSFLSSYDPFDRGVIFGTGWGASDQFVPEYETYRATGWASPLTSLIVMPNVATAALSMHWGLRGYQNTPIAACATGSLAIGDAYEIIRRGRAKVMLAGGGESLSGEFSIWAVDALKALSREQDDPVRACCPFGLRRSGFIMSEGAAVLCLEDLEAAVTRGAKILGEVVGYGSYSDSKDMSASGIDYSARVKTIQAALADAGINGDALEYINAHGTSTPHNDLSETRTLKAVLGEQAYRVPISSTKSYTGHLIAAAGAMESIFCMKAMGTGIVPATAHLTEPDPECDLDYVPNEHRQVDAPEFTLNANYGFGGVNTALIFRKYE